MNATEAETRITSAAAQLKLSMTTEFVPWSMSRNAGEKQPSLNWRVTLLHNGKPFLTTDYMAGSGHCPAYAKSVKELGGKNCLMRDEAIRWECEHGRAGTVLNGGGICNTNAKPLEPKLADVLHSLVMDADAIDCGDFEEWAEDMGYDTDSRKAEATYRACLEIGLKLRKAVGDQGMDQLRDACQDY